MSTNSQLIARQLVDAIDINKNTGAFTAYVAETMRFVSITKYGVKPGDDISAAINQALRENDRIYIPPGTYYIDPAHVRRTFVRFGDVTTFGAGIDIYRMSNKHIWFDGVIQSKPSNVDWIQVLNIQESKNIFLYGPKIIGDRYTHLSTIGEWAHGIGIYSCDEVYVYRPEVSKTWGDGIYTGIFYHDESGIQQGRVRIEDARIDDISRNGISLTSGKNTEIINPIITNVNRIAPMAGIDVEAEGIGTIRPVLENVTIVNPRIEKCSGTGIALVVIELAGRSQNTNIRISDYLGISNETGMRAYGTSGVLSGSIVISNPTVIEMKNFGIGVHIWHKNMPMLTFENPMIKNCNTTDAINTDGAGFFLSDMFTNDDLENIYIKNANIQDTRTPKKMTTPVWAYTKLSGIGEILIENPIRFDGLNTIQQNSGNGVKKIKMIDGFNVDAANLALQTVTISLRVSTSFNDGKAYKIGKVVYVNLILTLNASYAAGTVLLNLNKSPLASTRVDYNVDGGNGGRADVELNGDLKAQSALTSGQTITANFSYVSP